MIPQDKKLERLIQVAELYYEQNKTQSEIAALLSVSRPLVSVLLSEARAAGIVTITIHRVKSAEHLVSERLMERFHLSRVQVIPDEGSADLTDNALAAAAYDYCFHQDAPLKNAGVGWGSLLGRMADCVENLPDADPASGRIFPLIGGIGASYRGYHTNEIARILSAKTGLTADYLYLPAFFDSASDRDIARQMDAYRMLTEKWDRMDLALVNISNYPSYPDLGVEYRFGNRLTRELAVGRVLAHYYNREGRVIEPTIDNVMQATLGQLKAAKETVAVCSALLRPQSVIGALNAGFIDTLILPRSLGEKVLNFGN